MAVILTAKAKVFLKISKTYFDIYYKDMHATKRGKCVWIDKYYSI